MPSAAKKLVIVQNNEAPQASAPDAAPAARPEELRLLEALLFAAGQPLDEAQLARRMPNGVNVKEALAALKAEYATRGVNLIKIGKKWMFRTADDLSWLLTKETVETRKLSRAAVETLAIIAYVVEPALAATVFASSFASALELVREGLAEIHQKESFAPIYMRKRVGANGSATHDAQENA